MEATVPAPPTFRRRWALLLALMVGCGGQNSGSGSTASGPGADATGGAVASVATAELRKSFEGHWWVFCAEMPVHALFLSLEPAGVGRWNGSWISFDWRGTREPAQLARVSRPVEVSARTEREEIVIVGPVPQVDALGLPTGRRGSWELRLTRSSLPGQPLQYTGRMLHSDPVDAVDLPVELVSSYRPWSR